MPADVGGRGGAVGLFADYEAAALHAEVEVGLRRCVAVAEAVAMPANKGL